MFGSSMLDIAIGIIFVFLLLSIFATAINEIILSFLNMRGKILLRGIAALLNDKGAAGLAKDVYTNGQIYGLYEGVFNPLNPSNLPSYIPARNFALALLDVVSSSAPPPAAPPPAAPPPAAPPAAIEGQAAAAAQAAPPPQAPAEAPPQAPAAPGPVAAAQANLQAVVAISQSLRNAAQTLAGNADTEKVGKPLVAMIAMAGNDMAKLQTSIEDWYNSSMDRVSGWYKYHTQKVLLVIGLVMAISLNASAIKITQQIAKDPTLRQSLVAAAQSAKPPQSAAGQPIETQLHDTAQSFDDLNQLGLPLGWPHGFPPRSTWFQPHSLQALLGWLLTAIAISLGAPFWFDLLNKVMVIRSTVKPDEKSPAEASKS
jgi:hypothetical protein